MTQDPRKRDPSPGEMTPEDIAHGQELVRTSRAGGAIGLLVGVVVLIAAVAVVTWVVMSGDDDGTDDALSMLGPAMAVTVVA